MKSSSSLRGIGMIVPVACVLALSACGPSRDRDDRVVGGAAVGAATGAGVGAIFGGIGAIPGALIGGAVGAGAGAVTDEKDVDLGKPLWKRDE